ncbi:calcium-transporting ATPase 8, plasma membrane-type isoform X1 [Arabidopsis lyrata subsp. lyrata]|uniref:calcium-transporting ATPase 8, plasma membrane-type isoform X1 n=1 Tax=Arabidopsis lyrata subsp. lyrata TaxID=81972 RepID=UPI000A29DF21|nr:calcium-transporting ATPase 8, plasma membrane-type isoform X1 [Arabidopsis lyrata subsp. lyrata]XP_020868460.1 calcium-transporting ATPase 8, plasma membrane-type isoform X1 [Arabidopsis lyrata subsp. lyrata]XP_020868469.1 calcium-transporting ATPase 8, plasma membrane-type isoform X1 [Arabidopsis lyrata subsp. lyrata]|eukprot:XP_020868451.1 calcium-transporting ATPase 8, plasma membrane-type isoform X1 [Arabidopsis lyrata subsp. lyrata]
MVVFELSMFRFWKRPSNPKGGPGDIEVGLAAAGGYSNDDVAVPHLPEDLGGGSVPEAESGDLEAGLVTTDLPSSWRRGTLKRVSRALAFYRVISDMLRRNTTSDDQSLVQHDDDDQEAEQSANEPSTSGGFGIGLDELVQLVKDGGSLEALNRYNGVHGLTTLLKTDLKSGIDPCVDEIQHRRNTFGSNTYPSRKGKRFWCFLWRACKLSHFLVIFLAQVILSLLRVNTKGIFDGWYVEACIILAILLYIIVRAIIEYKQSRQFEILRKEKRNVHLEVIRSGRRFLVSNYDIVVGDIVPLKNGGQVPADGVLFVANSLIVDEQEITGSDEYVQKDLQRNPFLLSGSKLIDGIGTMLVTSVGMNTAWGFKMEIPQETDEEKPFQGYLKWLAISASWSFVLFASVACSVRLGRYFSGWTKKSDGTPMFIYGITTADEATEFVITSLSFGIATIVVAVPFGLSIAVRLNLAKTTRKMMTDKLLVQSLSAFERMGSVTTILCHQTGILTLNQMSVVDVWAGGMRMQDMDNVSQLPPFLKELIIEGIAQNTNGSVVFETGVTEPELYGSPTEQAILSFGNKLGMKFNHARSASLVRHTIPFSPKKKYGGVALQIGAHAHAHWKGSAKTILSSCERYMDGANNPRGIDDEKRKFFEGTIEEMCNKGLRCAALAYQPCELESLPTTIKEPRNLVLLAIIGIKDPCRPGTRDAIQLCNSGSVKVCMVMDYDVLTAQAIAIECGILTDASGRNIRTGAQFRELTDPQREQIAGDILVFAQSSPDDNLLLVQALKKRGHIVAATGMGIHDPKTLREAHVSLAMGVGGTAAAKENSDIIILDDNFATIVKCIIWSRSLYTNVQRSILFRLTVSVSALAICVVEVVVYDAFPLNVVQFLWLNLVIDILGALALAYRPSSGHHLMGKPPVGIRDPLITKAMWSKLIIQVIYLVLSLVLINSEKLLKLKHGHTGNAEKVMNTFVFNSLVFCLVFNEFEIRSVDQTFKQILRENMFLVTITSTIISQIIVIELAGFLSSSTRLDLKKWVTTSLLGLLSQVANRYPYPVNQYYRN